MFSLNSIKMVLSVTVYISALDILKSETNRETCVFYVFLVS